MDKIKKRYGKEKISGHRIIEQLGLERTLQPIHFQCPCHGQGCHSPDQASRCPIRSLALNATTDGASTTSLGSLFTKLLEHNTKQIRFEGRIDIKFNKCKVDIFKIFRFSLQFPLPPPAPKEMDAGSINNGNVLHELHMLPIYLTNYWFRPRLWKDLRCSYLQQGGWIQMILKVPFNSIHSMILLYDLFSAFNEYERICY